MCFLCPFLLCLGHFLPSFQASAIVLCCGYTLVPVLVGQCGDTLGLSQVRYLPETWYH